ncbi:MAG: Asp-tRNA(Asn)/Glu-tRNA(Gln) amidotransferase subunit GatC [Vicinamibacterales bacterium]
MSAAPLDDQEVRRIAALARLALTDDEVALFGRQLSDILEYVRQVQGEPTEGVAAMSHVTAGDPHERADDARPSLPRAAALGNAPDAAPEAGLFKVPRVIG